MAENLAGMNSLPEVESEVLANSSATVGKCTQECNTVGLWLLLIGLVVFLAFVMQTPVTIVTIR